MEANTKPAGAISTTTQASESNSMANRDTWRSLGRLLEYFEGRVICVELKCGLEVKGILDGVDVKDLSMIIGKASQRWIEGRRKGSKGPDMELVLIAGPRVRYVHFPDKIDLDVEMRKWHTQTKKAAWKRNYIVDRPKPLREQLQVQENTK
mmetsp:Transcript_15490/g.28432  ORF Transcript_15490/g.28432 Transcript_15490/m.28432 type:complete len:151 (-) Transcript_15490:195-647(-)